MDVCYFENRKMQIMLVVLLCVLNSLCMHLHWGTIYPFEIIENRKTKQLIHNVLIILVHFSTHSPVVLVFMSTTGIRSI